MKYFQLNSKRVLGYLTILASSIFFYAATVFLKKAMNVEDASPLIFVHARFILGFLLCFPFYWHGRRSMPIVNHRQLLIRSFTNTVAVCFFFMGVHYGSVTNANLLNMTYPAFVALLAPVLVDEKLLPMDIWALVFSLAGIILITEPQNKAFSMGDIWGLASGIFAAWAIVSLRIVRKTDHTLTILTYVFGFGSLFFLPVPFLLSMPKTKGVYIYLIFSSLTGVLGQLTLTFGYKFVSALEGSIISSSRLVFAILFGLIYLEDNIGPFIITGGTLILLSNILEAFRNHKIH